MKQAPMTDDYDAKARVSVSPVTSTSIANILTEIKPTGERRNPMTTSRITILAVASAMIIIGLGG